MSFPSLVASLTLGLLSAVGSLACSNPIVTIPPKESPPSGVTKFVGPSGGDITFGTTCSGYIFVDADVGYAFCDAGMWEYTTTDPEGDGYTDETPGGTVYTGTGGGGGGGGGQQ